MDRPGATEAASARESTGDDMTGRAGASRDRLYGQRAVRLVIDMAVAADAAEQLARVCPICQARLQEQALCWACLSALDDLLDQLAANSFTPKDRRRGQAA
jgi:hypothetical protein